MPFILFENSISLKFYDSIGQVPPGQMFCNDHNLAQTKGENNTTDMPSRLLCLVTISNRLSAVLLTGGRCVSWGGIFLKVCHTSMLVGTSHIKWNVKVWCFIIWLHDHNNIKLLTCLMGITTVNLSNVIFKSDEKQLCNVPNIIELQ